MNNNQEIWKAIPGYEGYYEVSNLGRIKSLSRTVTRSDGVNPQIKERYLKLITQSNGYVYIKLCKKGIKDKTIKNAVAVAMAFMDHKPDGTHKVVVDHKDRNRQNNVRSNLRLISNRENCNRKHLKSSSRYTGVSFHKRDKKWDSRAIINGKQIYLGGFKKEIDAHHAYQKAVNEIKIQEI